MKVLDLTKMRFGRLQVVERAPNAGRASCWQCLCDCGVSKVIRGNHLRSGATTSCGCYAREVAGAVHRTHGMSRSPEYTAWCDMRSRCSDESDREFLNYGARGIRVHESWNVSFEEFLRHIGPRPSQSHSLDRIDNDRNYEPGNVRWATALQQVRNRRVTKLSLEKAEQIRALRRQGATYKTLARDFGVSEGSVGFVLSGAQWRAD